MPPKKQDRQYEIVLLGATGYTGALTAEHIVQHLPTNLRWAIAGRSRKKLEELATRLKQLVPDRLHPTIEIVSADQHDQLDAITKRTKVCISIVSYSHVGTQVVESCIENGTDYVDAFAGIVKLGQWIPQYHDKAKATGVALIHACAAFSAPQDVLTKLAVRKLKQLANLPTREVVLAIKQINLSPSGGTVDSILTPPKINPETRAKSRDPWYLSPIHGATNPGLVNTLGFRRDPHLGLLLASAYSARQDQAIVHRTWGLVDDGNKYGEKFYFNEYESVSSTLHGLWKLFSITLLGFFISLGPVARLFLPRPGDGPDPRTTKHAATEMEAMAVPDGDSTKRTIARFKYVGGSYHVTALFLAQGAASLLYNRELESGYDGGSLTPAMLGADFVNRLKTAGAEIDVQPA